MIIKSLISRDKRKKEVNISIYLHLFTRLLCLLKLFLLLQIIVCFVCFMNKLYADDYFYKKNCFFSPVHITLYLILFHYFPSFSHFIFIYHYWIFHKFKYVFANYPVFKFEKKIKCCDVDTLFFQIGFTFYTANDER